MLSDKDRIYITYSPDVNCSSRGGEASSAEGLLLLDDGQVVLSWTTDETRARVVTAEDEKLGIRRQSELKQHEKRQLARMMSKFDL